MTPTRRLSRCWPLTVLSCALVLAGCGGNRAQPRGSDLEPARTTFLSFFEKADSLQVYTLRWPGESEREHVLTTVSRRDSPELWSKFLEGVRSAGAKGAYHGGIPIIHIRLLASERALVQGWAFPPAHEIGLYLPDGKRTSLIAPALDKFFQPLHDEVTEARARASGIQPLPATSHARPREELATFEETKSRMIRLFRNCSYLNVHAPGENSMGVDVRQEAEDAWEAMTKAVEDAKKGWAISGRPEVYIWCESADAPGRPVEVNYIAGVLGSTDPGLGANILTLRVGLSFEEALNFILAMARERERREQQDGHL